jgi:hypothetical protein
VTIRLEAYGGAPGIECPAFDVTHVVEMRTLRLDGAPAYAPFRSWKALVDQQYRDLLGRAPTTTESNSWVSQLAAGTRRAADLIDAIRRSADHRANVDPIHRLYWPFFHRGPDRSGFQYWIDRRRTGRWPLVRVADTFAASREFRRKYGALTNEQYVRRIYNDVLIRVPDPNGLEFWTRQLDQARRSRGAVMLAFSESAERKRSSQRSTDANVAHLLLLGRPLTDAESYWWTYSLGYGVPQQELITELLNSAEYQARVG